MAMMLFVVTLLSGLALAMQVIANSAYRTQRSSLEARQAFYLAEAGISRAVASMIAGGAGAVGSEAEPVGWGTGELWVETTDLGDGKISLISIARVSRVTRLIEAIVEPNPEAETPPLFGNFGLFGGDGVWLISGERLSSYDSRLGGIGASPRNDRAQIGSNLDVAMSSGSRVAGDALAGPSASVHIANGAAVSGSAGNLTAFRDMDLLVDVPTITSSGPLVLTDSLSLGAGDHHFTNLEIVKGADLVIHGPATVVLDSFTLESGAQLLADTSEGAVTIWCTGAVDVSGSLDNSSTSPIDLHLLIASDTDDYPVNLAPKSPLHALLHAPNADMRIGHGDRFYGAISARSLLFDSGSRIYHDLAADQVYLLEEGIVTSPPPEYRILSWRTLSADEKLSLDAGSHPHDVRGAYADEP